MAVVAIVMEAVIAAAVSPVKAETMLILVLGVNTTRDRTRTEGADGEAAAKAATKAWTAQCALEPTEIMTNTNAMMLNRKIGSLMGIQIPLPLILSGA